MSFYDPFTSPDIDNTTPQNHDASHQLSPYQRLEMEVLERAPQQCYHDFSTPRLTDLWKNSWNEKVCLLWLRAEGKNWPDIIQWFAEKGIEKSYDALRLKWTRVSNEVMAMHKAVKQYEVDWSVENKAIFWDWISASMKENGAQHSWTGDKVKYAWHRGVSVYFNDVFKICPDKISATLQFYPQ